MNTQIEQRSIQAAMFLALVIASSVPVLAQNTLSDGSGRSPLTPITTDSLSERSNLHFEAEPTIITAYNAAASESLMNFSVSTAPVSSIRQETDVATARESGPQAVGPPAQPETPAGIARFPLVAHSNMRANRAEVGLAESTPTDDSNSYRRWPAWVDGRSQPATGLAMGSVIKQIAGSTIVVLAIVVASLVLLKRSGLHHRLAGRKLPTSVAAPKFRVLKTLKIGARSFLQIVEAEGSRFLVGVDSGGIKSIVKIVSAFDAHLTCVDRQHDGDFHSSLDAEPVGDNSPPSVATRIGGVTGLASGSNDESMMDRRT